MITFCGGRFAAHRDTYQWILTEYYEGKDKHGNVKTNSRISYHPNLSQVCGKVIDKCMGDCETLEEVISLLKNANLILTKGAESVSEH